ncbi:hypothetical protein GBAR_LOCUS21712, partial [Geodia barretti]
MKLKRWCYAVVFIAACYCCVLLIGVTILDTERSRRERRVRSETDHPWERQHAHGAHQSHTLSSPPPPTCSPPPPPPHLHCRPPKLKTVLIVGVLHSVGAWLANQLTGSHWTVRGLARDTAISTNNLLWYRRDQLT